MPKQKTKPVALPAGRRNVTRKPTLKTIAQMSGLAVATVSRALSDAPDIGADTKKLVRRIAAEVGYVPNRAGVRLRTGRTNVISLVLSTEHEIMDHTARLIASIAGALRETPYHLIITPFFPDQDPMEPVRYVVETGSADAVILNQTQPEDPRVKYLIEKGFPFATHGRTDFGAEHPYFDFDNRIFGKLGIEELARKGCRNVVMIAPPRAQTYSRHMIEGARAEAEARGISLRIEDKTDSDSPNEQQHRCVVHRLEENPEVDGYITGSAKAAIAAVGAFEKHGRVLGKDIELFTKEAVPLLKLFRKEIMVVTENVAQAGRFLAEAAIQSIRESGAPPMQGLEIPRMERQESAETGET